MNPDPSAWPYRLLLDTCILNALYEEGGYIFEGELDEGCAEEDVDPDHYALRRIFAANERVMLDLVVSPLTVAEVANIQDFRDRERRVRWVLDVLDSWLCTLDSSRDRVKHGGTVRHRFKLTDELQDLEQALMGIPDLRRDPFDRLLLLQCRMGQCDAFLTTDAATVWRHREELWQLGIWVLSPEEFWARLGPHVERVM